MDTAILRPQNPSVLVAVTGKKFGIRAGAYIIDTIVILVIDLAISFVAGLLLGIVYAVINGRAPALAGNGNQLVNYIVGFILTTIYFTLFEWLHGATPGKLILGMRVIKEDGRACGLGSAFIRALLRLIDGLIFGLVAYRSMEEPLYQRVGDKSAKTIVVGSKDPAIQQVRPWWGFLVAAVSYLVFNSIVIFIWLLAALQ